MECLNEVEDPRQASNGTRHDFQEILVIAICAMLSDSDSVEDFSEWGRLKLDWLRRFLVLKNGIPSQDTFLRVFRALDPKQFEAAFRRWTGCHRPAHRSHLMIGTMEPGRDRHIGASAGSA